MNMERVRQPKVRIIGETDWREDLRRWTARIVVFAAFAVVAFIGAWAVIHVETPALRQLTANWI